MLPTREQILAEIKRSAEAMDVAVGQVYEWRGPLSLSPRRAGERVNVGPRWSRILIVQVPGGRKTTIRYVKVDPPTGGNGRPDRQRHTIARTVLARCYVLTEPAPADPEGSADAC